MKRFSINPEFFLLLAACMALKREREVLATLISLFWHEMGHILAVLSVNLPIYRGKMTPFGLKIFYEEGLAGPEEKVFVLISGPIINLGTACYLLTSGRSEEALAGMALGIYNLLPLDGLDGGECLKVLLPEKGTRIIRDFSCFVMGLLTVLFGIGLYKGKINLYMGLVALAMAFRVFKKAPPNDKFGG